MISGTQTAWSPVVFIESPEHVHHPVRVSLGTCLIPATPTRPRRSGWQLEVTNLDGKPICTREMAEDCARESSPGLAMRADAAKHRFPIPALAAYHPDLGISGLSHEVGGWLAGRSLRYGQALFPGCFPVVRRVSEDRVSAYHQTGAIAIATLPSIREFALNAVPADRVFAMLQGIAIGDALGNPSESMTASDRRSKFGWIETLTNPTPSDDTQMTLRTLHSLFRRGRVDPVDLHRSWTAAHITGIGHTVRTAFRQQAERLRHSQDPWTGRVHHNAAGNGSLMRVAGVVAPYALCHPESMPSDLLLASAFTHDDPSANAACVGWAAVLLALGQPNDPLSDPARLFEVFLQTARPIEGTHDLRTRTPHLRFSGSLCDFIEQEVVPAHQSPSQLQQRRDTWYSGAYLVPAPEA